MRRYLVFVSGAVIGLTLLVPDLRAQAEHFETAKLTNFGPTKPRLGQSVSVSGDVLVAGAPDYFLQGPSLAVGGVYVFERGADWTSGNEIGVLSLASAQPGSGLGHSVAISGDTVVGGGLYAESAYVFVKPGSGWASGFETATLTASDGGLSNWFGISVAISGDTIVVGAESAPGGGAAYVFVKPVSGWVDMTETAKLTASDGGGFLGSSVGIDGDTVVVGARAASGGGAAYAYEKPVSGWVSVTETAKLTSTVASSEWFGAAVAVSGDCIVVGARRKVTVAGSRGAAYVFEEPAGGWVNGTETARLTTSSGAQQDGFGGAVSVSGQAIVAGADFADIKTYADQGAAYLFQRPQSGWVTATETAMLFATDGGVGSQLGVSVALDGDTVFVGSANHLLRGSAYVFEPPYVAARSPYISWLSDPILFNMSLPDTITVNGYGLDCSTGFSVGGMPVAVSSQAERQLVFTLPRDFPLGAYQVSVACPGTVSNALPLTVDFPVPSQMSSPISHDRGATHTYSAYTGAGRTVLFLISPFPGTTALPGIVSFPLGGGHFNAIVVAATLSAGNGGIADLPVTMPTFVVPPFNLYWSALIFDPQIPLGLQVPLETAFVRIVATTM